MEVPLAQVVEDGHVEWATDRAVPAAALVELVADKCHMSGFSFVIASTNAAFGNAACVLHEMSATVTTG